MVWVDCCCLWFRNMFLNCIILALVNNKVGLFLGIRELLGMILCFWEVKYWRNVCWILEVFIDLDLWISSWLCEVIGIFCYKGVSLLFIVAFLFIGWVKNGFCFDYLLGFIVYCIWLMLKFWYCRKWNCFDCCFIFVVGLGLKWRL